MPDPNSKEQVAIVDRYLYKLSNSLDRIYQENGVVAPHTGFVLNQREIWLLMPEEDIKKSYRRIIQSVYKHAKLK